MPRNSTLYRAEVSTAVNDRSCYLRAPATIRTAIGRAFIKNKKINA